MAMRVIYSRLVISAVAFAAMLALGVAAPHRAATPLPHVAAPAHR